MHSNFPVPRIPVSGKQISTSHNNSHSHKLDTSVPSHCPDLFHPYTQVLFRKQHDPMPASDALPCGFLLCQSACQFNRIYQIRVIHTVNCCKHPQFLHLAFTLQKQPGTGISITAHLQSVNPCHHSCPYSIVVRVDRKKAKFFYPCKCTQTLKQQSSRFTTSISPLLVSQTTSTRFRFFSSFWQCRNCRVKRKKCVQFFIINGPCII